ncbi:MAG: MBL fold metallo-hydrolase [Oscillospiraceae bacterium]|nr:MBL fold metallo-hydrolase [Oscillospiraceae bacterium]
MNRNNPYSVMQVAEDLYVIQESSVRCFLLLGKEAALLIDTGFGTGDLKAEIAEITKLPVIVANTHSDLDHIGGNYQFERSYLHVAEFARYRDIERVQLSGDSEERHTLVPMWESDFIDIGGGILEIILLPGHTPGSVAFIERNNGILFPGDSILSECIDMHNDHKHKGRNLESYIYSLEKLLCMKEEFNTIYCSHQALTFPVGKIESLAKGARRILAGEIEGVLPSNDSPYAIYDIGGVKIFY